MDLNKALAEIALVGVFNGYTKESNVIIDALQKESMSETAKISLKAVQLMSNNKFDEMITLLNPWCKDNQDKLDTPHAFLALALWRTGDSNGSKQLCNIVISSECDIETKNMASDILAQIGV